MADKPDAVELPRVRGEIRFDRVTFSYGGDALALDDVTLDVPPGQTLALVGATGAGKSTLAKLVARFYDPDEGRVLIDGHDLRDVTEQSLRSQLGIVPQESFLFSGTIGDNIALRPRGRDRRGGRGPRRRRSARTTSSSGCRTATTPRWESAAGTCRRASASSWPSRARRRQTRAS